MEWTRVPYELDLRAADGRPMGAGRDPGPHIGALVRSAVAREGKTFSEIKGEQYGVRIQAGFNFETAIEAVIAGVSPEEALLAGFRLYMHRVRQGSRQVTLHHAGITGTPDALIQGWIESYKLTWRKMTDWNTTETSFRHWHLAECCYLYMARQLGHDVEGVRFFVYWINGDYSRRPGGGPQVARYDCRYTDTEVRTAWLLVKAELDLRLRNEEEVKRLKSSSTRGRARATSSPRSRRQGSPRSRRG